MIFHRSPINIFLCVEFLQVVVGIHRLFVSLVDRLPSVPHFDCSLAVRDMWPLGLIGQSIHQALCSFVFGLPFIYEGLNSCNLFCARGWSSGGSNWANRAGLLLFYHHPQVLRLQCRVHMYCPSSIVLTVQLCELEGVHIC